MKRFWPFVRNYWLLLPAYALGGAYAWFAVQAGSFIDVIVVVGIAAFLTLALMGEARRRAAAQKADRTMIGTWSHSAPFDMTAADRLQQHNYASETVFENGISRLHEFKTDK